MTDDQITLLLINGMTPERVARQLAGQGEAIEAAERRVGEARKRITLAADYSRSEKLGVSIGRWEDLYTKAVTAKDWATAAKVNANLDKLLRLQEPIGAAAAGMGSLAGAAGEKARQELELVESYLRPLGLVGEGYPICEAARVAAERIRRMSEPGTEQIKHEGHEATKSPTTPEEAAGGMVDLATGKQTMTDRNVCPTEETNGQQRTARDKKGRWRKAGTAAAGEGGGEHGQVRECADALRQAHGQEAGGSAG